MRIVRTPQFDADQLHIEDHIFESNGQEVKSVEHFIKELDSAILWIQANALTPKEDDTGDRSWPFYRDHRGLFRYRVKYLVAAPSSALVLKRIIDNREQNLDIYPTHKLDSFSADDE